MLSAAFLLNLVLLFKISLSVKRLLEKKYDRHRSKMKSSSTLFEDIIVPLLYPADSESLWKIDSASINALNRALAGEVTISSVQSTPKRYTTTSTSSSSFSPSSSPKRSIISLAGGAGGKSLTYGEVIPTSIEQHVIPQLDLKNGDVVVDLGSGTGKIPLQIALYSQLNGINVRCRGIELAHERHVYAELAYQHLSQVSLQDLSERMKLKSSNQEKTYSASSSPSLLLSSLQDIANKVEAIEGDLLFADLSDVTVIFVNNTVFDPALMIKLSHLLADRSRVPKLRKLVLLRALCCRHSSRCEKLNSSCCAFQHPPQVTICNPTWCNETTLFTYTVSQAWTLSKRWTSAIDTYSTSFEPETPLRSKHSSRNKKQQQQQEGVVLDTNLSITPTHVPQIPLNERRKRKLSEISRDLSDGVEDLLNQTVTTTTTTVLSSSKSIAKLLLS